MKMKNSMQSLRLSSRFLPAPKGGGFLGEFGEVEGYENGKKTKRLLLPIKTVCDKLKYDFLACFSVVW